MDLKIELVRAFEDFGFNVAVESIQRGPLVTTLDISIQRGVKAKQIIALASDVGRLLSVQNVRITMSPGKSTLAVEIPNSQRDNLDFIDLLQDRRFTENDGALPVILGVDKLGVPVISDLAVMPHLLVAGTTGSGKSVGVNGMIISLLVRYEPSECQFLFIDPKMLELSIYDGIPHLIQPTVTDPASAITSLQGIVDEMERRYRLMAEAKVRNIANFNERFSDKLPYIVVVIDEFADLIQTSGKTLEALVQRIAQKARAAGIHLIMATQRPSVDVVTGVLKANLPTRISYRVASGFDSRTILGEEGAENLLGKGDMLFMEGSQTRRVHGAFVSDSLVEQIVAPLRSGREVEAVVESTTESPEAPCEQPNLSQQAKVLFMSNPSRRPSMAWLIREFDIEASQAEKVLRELGIWQGLFSVDSIS